MRAHRIRLPPWRQVGYDPAEDVDLHPITWILALLLSVVLLFVPLVVFIFELSITVVRSLFSSERRVSALCRWPSEIRIIWRTTRGNERRVAAEVARQLELVYEHLAPEGAELVSMTKPPGFEHLSS